MQIVCLDLEGVLLPEFWIAVADATGLPELRRTTRDEPDYDVLMRYRLAILDQHGLTIDRIHQAIAGLDPLPGAVEFTRWLTSRTRLVVLSDTFVQFAEPLMAKLGHPTLFCHELEISPRGRITGYRLRQSDQKRRAVEAFRQLSFETIAAGDSYNDLTMLQAADHGILFRPPQKMRSEYPAFPCTHTHEELRAHLESLGV